jgi:hypothetical protein
MCLAQGVLWTLVLSGWRHWNQAAKFSGRGVGARIRRWWWGVNNWKIPDAKSRFKDTKLAKNVTEVSAAFLKVRHQTLTSTMKLGLMIDAVLQGRVLKRCPGLSVVIHSTACTDIHNYNITSLGTVLLTRYADALLENLMPY